MTIRTAEIENEVIDRLTSGEPLAAVLRSPGMPKPSTWYDWCAADEALSGRVARARTNISNLFGCASPIRRTIARNTLP